MDIISVFLVLTGFGLTVFENVKMNDIKQNLIAAVKFLSEDIGQRSYVDIEKLNKAANYIEEKFRLYRCDVKRQAFIYNGRTYFNIIAEVKGTQASDKGILVIGAHYDSVEGTPGADDNASGVAGLLELARLTALKPLKKTVCFVAFSLEEPPVFMSKHMGSYVYAKSLRDNGASVSGMISLEMLGYFCDEENCQFYPLSIFRWIYPEKGNFISFVGNISSKEFTKKVKSSFKKFSSIPVESLNTVSLVPGVDFSDHRSFWEFGYPAFMITDTAFYRNPNYHSASDTASTLDYERMTELIAGLHKTISFLFG